MKYEVKVTKQQAEEEMEFLNRIFDVVRLVKENELQQMEQVNISGQEMTYCECYAFWQKGHHCTDCVAMRALKEKGEAAKFELLGSQIFQVLARYMEIDGEPYVMELLKHLDQRMLSDINDYDAFVSKIAGFSEKLYLDALTGAHNRRFYEDEVRKKTEAAGVAMIDLDDFKLYNDTYGHSAGDMALTTTADIIKKCIRKTDTLIRYGGDEFLLIFDGVTHEILEKKLEQIKSMINSAVVPGYLKLQLSVSIGGVISPEGTLMESSVEQADKLMYIAKNHKNMVVTDGSEQSRLDEENERLLKSDIKQQILIVDDSDLNREILSAMLENDYNILEASNGQECLDIMQQFGTGIALILLDIVMPVMDGFEVLAYMNRNHWIEDTPVIMISSEDSMDNIRKAYELGVSDYISRPFDSKVVYRRVFNMIKLYAKQRRLTHLLTQQMYEKEKNSQLMVGILSQIVEFRNGESGKHVLHINTLTQLILERLVQKSDRYMLSWAEQYMIATASALHDIGKVGIDEKILNKPGKLTEEEYEIIKTHTLIGASMLENLDIYHDEMLVKLAYQICRWHHERYDGSGYPDGLKGEEIPIAAQVVSLADVYDALVSTRVYKEAYSHEKAVSMIMSGECGSFNPLLLECLYDIQDKIKQQINYDSEDDEPVGSHIVNIENILQFNESQVNESGGGTTSFVKWLDNDRQQHHIK